jgi:hypothetical protein
MGIFKRKDNVIDLSARYKKQQSRPSTPAASARNSSSTSEGATDSGFSFLSNLAAVGAQNNSRQDYAATEEEDSEDKRKKLAKRILDLTDRVEELSIQLYHLQQRIELIERKMNVGFS